MFWNVEGSWLMCNLHNDITEHLQVTNIHDSVTQVFASLCACSSNCENVSLTLCFGAGKPFHLP